ncbi:MAG: M3 family oligoendopeptidase [Pseudomonadota bacterium]
MDFRSLRTAPSPAPDTALAADTAADLGDLPEWRLEDLYAGLDDPQLNADLDQVEERAERLAERNRGRVAELSGAELAAAVAEYEAIDEIIGRVMSFAYLVYAGDVSNPEFGAFLQAMQERVTKISSAHLLFLTLEINRLGEDALQAKLVDPALQRYQPWLRDVRAFADHQLSDELEQYAMEKQVSGRSAWVRLFDETIADLRFPIGGKELGSAEALDRLSSHDRAERREAAESISQVFAGNIRLFAHITNTLAKDKQTEDGWRKFAKPWSSRNLSNYVEDEVVDALASAVQSAYPRLSHRYYGLKAKWMGLEKLATWDRNAPLPDEIDRKIGWDEARKTVLDAYGGFAPEMAEIGQRFFDKGWIDAPARQGKSPGAFAHPTVPSAHPYILLNYLGKPRDVMTLAHELGHGVHQVLAGAQGQLMSDTPLTLAETASVFGEMLTFRSILEAETDPKARRVLLAGKVEDMLNTVVRQIAFFEFERRVHSERQSGELSADRLGEIWLDVQRESLGPAIDFDEGYQVFWAYIPHFIHSPFYVYAYAFGDCLVNSLYATYLDAPDGFQQKYFEMLRAGGTLRHKELLAPFGLDATDPEFWSRGLTMIESMIDELAEAGA